MSYLNQPRLCFAGQFRADPSTVNNTPDNFNPNNNFPPHNGNNVGDNIQLYWNPNGTGQFTLNCTINQVLDRNGRNDLGSQLLGQRLFSLQNSSLLSSAKVVDLDSMQQNVTELWGLSIQIGGEEGGSTPEQLPAFIGDYTASAYSNAWVQVLNGQGDYAGSAQYQSVLSLDECAQLADDPTIQDMLQQSPTGQLSIAFVLRSFNAASINYLINPSTLATMHCLGVPKDVTDKLKVLQFYNQGPQTLPPGSMQTATPPDPFPKGAGQIPTPSYFEKLLSQLLDGDKTYWPQIKQAAALPYTPNTDYDFTYGQVFGVVGPHMPDEPDFMTVDRMLTPASQLIVGDTGVGSDSGSYKGYFAPFTVREQCSHVVLNLGNSLPSSQPASNSSSNVVDMGQMNLCYFEHGVSVEQAVSVGEAINYQDNGLYLTQGGLACVAFEPQLLETLKTKPLGILIHNETAQPQILLHENPEGFYLRANKFVYRMNPGIATTAEQPRGNTQMVEIYASQFGQPLANSEIYVAMMSSLDAQTYSFNTLGTGFSTGLVNMSVPQSALQYSNFVVTDNKGRAVVDLTASDPGAPRGYLDGQIYYLNYGFASAGQNSDYVQSADDLISVQVYSQQPVIGDITWDNFVAGILDQYNKLYPVMGFMHLNDEQYVKEHAQQIYDALARQFSDGALMPVTRDLSESRLNLLLLWLAEQAAIDHVEQRKQ